MHLKVCDFGTITQSRNLYGDALKRPLWTLRTTHAGHYVTPFHPVTQTEKGITGGLWALVYVLSTHFHQRAWCTCWQPLEGAIQVNMSRTEHGNTRHPSVSTIIYDYKSFWMSTSTILYIFEMDILLVLLSCENTEILCWWWWWRWWWRHKKVWHQHLDGPQSLAPMDQREKLFLRS